MFLWRSRVIISSEYKADAPESFVENGCGREKSKRSVTRLQRRQPGFDFALQVFKQERRIGECPHIMVRRKLPDPLAVAANQQVLAGQPYRDSGDWRAKGRGGNPGKIVENPFLLHGAC